MIASDGNDECDRYCLSFMYLNSQLYFSQFYLTTASFSNCQMFYEESLPGVLGFSLLTSHCFLTDYIYSNFTHLATVFYSVTAKFSATRTIPKLHCRRKICISMLICSYLESKNEDLRVSFN